MTKYDPKAFEKKWQERWQKENVFASVPDKNKEKFYILVEFPYPSGNGLHIGHTRPYTAMDALARSRRMRGQNVLFPIGWDAFGLPAENYAIKNKVHPAEVTRKNIDAFRLQAMSLGYSFDYSREVDTTNPDYYKWTQWIFLKLFEKGLAYKAFIPVNWCLSCKCVLANEEVAEGCCERCGGEIAHKEKSQWMLKITDYAQKLLDGLDTVEYPTRVKAQQRNWIGRSQGAEVTFKINGRDMLVYTTRPDTLFGATYMVLSPEHPLLAELEITNREMVDEYRAKASKKSEFERAMLNKDKTGVKLEGVSAVNPCTGEDIPVFISDYVLMGYGTGAIMAVPAHDQRDWEFAEAFNLPVIEVVKGGDVTKEAYTDTETGIMINSGFLNGLEVEEAKKTVTAWLSEKGLGTPKVNYRLRDWVFARQRYWGEPIPIVHCPACGTVPLPESELPLRLPEVKSYETTDTGESPLSLLEDFVNTTCPICGMAAKRETDTMPQWAGSSWYFLRYTDPHNDKELASKEALDYWMAVDWYNGGMEHTTLHMLYSRFWHKFLFDIGAATTPEPYKKRTAHGEILGEDGEKMSKSRGNTVDPMSIVRDYGADTMRLSIMFVGDFEKAASWSPQTIKGCRRFLEKVWQTAEKAKPSSELTPSLERAMHMTIKKVSEDIESLKFNTAIAALMSLISEMSECTIGDMRVFLTLLSPFAPHISEELWEKLGGKGFVSLEKWPSYDMEKCLLDELELAVQISGKLRGTIILPRGAEDEAVIKAALEEPRIARYAEGKELVKAIVIKDKLVNLILR